jgi:hypothetical protein
VILPPPAAYAGADNAICEGESYLIADATAGNYSTVLWTGGAGSFDDATLVNPTYTPDAAEYGTTVTLCIEVFPTTPCTISANDCMDLFIQMNPTVNAGVDQTVCEGSDVQLAATATDYTTALWTGGLGSYSDATMLDAVYTPDATEYGTTVTLCVEVQPISPCVTTASDCMDVFIQMNPTVNAGVDQTVCEGSDVQLAATATDYTSALWTGGLGSYSDATMLDAVYTPDATEYGTTVTLCVEVQPISPCVTTASDCMDVFIQMDPTVNAGVDQTVCEGSDVQLAATATDYSSALWTGGLGSYSDATMLDAIYTPDAQEYGTTVTLCVEVQPISPCVATASDCMDVFIQMNPTVDAGADQTVCEGSDVVLYAMATDFTTALWSGGLGTFSEATMLSTLYTPDAAEYGTTVTLCVEVQPISPCVTKASDCMDVFINIDPTLNSGVEKNVCEG